MINAVIMTPPRQRRIAVLAALSLGIGCSMLASPASSQSLSDRFKGLFGGGKSEEPAPATGRDAPKPIELTCPPVDHSRRRLHLCGGSAGQAGGRQRSALSGDDHPHRARLHASTAARSPRGSAFRAASLPALPARRPPSRCRCASRWCRAASSEKTIATKVYRTTVSMTRGGSVPFSAGGGRSGLSGAAGRGRRFTTSSISASIRRR